jgi:hypothetical protein
MHRSIAVFYHGNRMACIGQLLALDSGHRSIDLIACVRARYVACPLSVHAIFSCPPLTCVRESTLEQYRPAP